MSTYDDISHGSDMPGPDGPPLEAEGLDRPDEVEDALDDTAAEFNEGDAESEKLDDDSDNESLLSDVDEAVIEDFDENKLEIAPDFEQLRSTKIKKRKRDDNEDAQPKKKERTRERARRRRGEDEEVDATAPVRKQKGVRVRAPEIDEETLAPEERRRRALDRAMDAAVKRTSGGAKRRKGEIVRLVAPFEAELTATGSRTNGRRRTQ